jgi:hypothetical protein
MRGTKSCATVTPQLFSLSECDLSNRSVRSVTKLVAAVLVPRSEIRDSLGLSTGTPLAFSGCAIADLITAGRRECWGSQIGGAEGHRNDAMPFCFVRRSLPAEPSSPPSAPRPRPKEETVNRPRPPRPRRRERQGFSACSVCSAVNGASHATFSPLSAKNPSRSS